MFGCVCNEVLNYICPSQEAIQTVCIGVDVACTTYKYK